MKTINNILAFFSTISLIAIIVLVMYDWFIPVNSDDYWRIIFLFLGIRFLANYIHDKIFQPKI